MASTTSFNQNTRGVFYPPLDGSLFLPEMVEFNANYNTTHPFYTFHDEHLNDLCHISHLEFYRACQRVAHAVRPNRQGPDNDIIAIIANCDTILYQALTMGIIYAGLVVCHPLHVKIIGNFLISFLKPFPMSPRNSPAAVVNMMRKVGCRRLIATRHSLAPLLVGISAELAEVQIEDLPTLAYAYPELGKETANTPFVPYPKGGTRPLKDNVMFYLHSSGSTGFPKPIPLTNISAVHWCIMRECSLVRNVGLISFKISVHTRPCQFTQGYHDMCCSSAFIPYDGHAFTPFLSCRFAPEYSCVFPDVLSRSNQSSYHTQRT